MKKVIILSLLVTAIVFAPLSVSSQGDPAPPDVDNIIEDQVEPLPGFGQISEQQREDALRAQQERERDGKIVERCSAVTEKVTTHSSNFTKYRDSHISIITRVDERLNRLLERVQDSEVLSETALGESVASYKSLVGEFEVKLLAYETSLKELSVQECDTDVNARDMYSMLQSLRTLHAELEASQNQAKEFLKNDIKQALNDLKDQISASADDMGDTDGE